MKLKKHYKRLDSETLKEITMFVSSELDRQHEENAKKKRNRVRANVKILLRNYRDILEHVEEAVVEAVQVTHDLSLQELLALMGSSREKVSAETIKLNIANAKLLLNHVEKMIDVYRIICEKSKKCEEKRRFRVVYQMYFSSDKKTVEEIATAENIDISTVYKDINAASERLSVLFFGIDGLQLHT